MGREEKPMAYFLPLRMLKIGPEISIPIHRITLIGSINSYALRTLVLEHKKRKTLINASGREQTKSVVLLDNGAVCTSSYTANTLNKKVNDLQRYEVTSEVLNGINCIDRARKNEPEEVDTDELLRQIRESFNGDEEEDEAGDDDRDPGEI